MLERSDNNEQKKNHNENAFGRDVGCVPYPADEQSACNELIKEGAAMIENAEDVLLMMK